MVAVVTVFGTAGYVGFGFTPLDALYQTITTITTVGFRELTEFGTGEKIFTIILIVIGVSTVLYTFTLVVQLVVEGQLSEFVGRRRMDRQINQLRNHTIVCGWGRVGAAVAQRRLDGRAGREARGGRGVQPRHHLARLVRLRHEG